MQDAKPRMRQRAAVAPKISWKTMRMLLGTGDSGI